MFIENNFMKCGLQEIRQNKSQNALSVYTKNKNYV